MLLKGQGPVMKAIALKQTLAINTVTPVNCWFFSLSPSLSAFLFISLHLPLSLSLIMMLWMQLFCLYWESNKKREVRGCVWDPLVCLLKVILSSPRHWTTDLCMGLQTQMQHWNERIILFYNNINAKMYTCPWYYHNFRTCIMVLPWCSVMSLGMS